MKRVIMLFPLMLGLLFAGVNVYAADRISNELATVKACASHATYADLNEIYDVIVHDSGKQLTVDLKWKHDGADCVGWHWLTYDGADAGCEYCQGMPNCACAIAMCQMKDGSAPVTRYKSF